MYARFAAVAQPMLRAAHHLPLRFLRASMPPIVASRPLTARGLLTQRKAKQKLLPVEMMWQTGIKVECGSLKAMKLPKTLPSQLSDGCAQLQAECAGIDENLFEGRLQRWYDLYEQMTSKRYGAGQAMLECMRSLRWNNRGPPTGNDLLIFNILSTAGFDKEGLTLRQMRRPDIEPTPTRCQPSFLVRARGTALNDVTLGAVFCEDNISAYYPSDLTRADAEAQLVTGALVIVADNCAKMAAGNAARATAGHTMLAVPGCDSPLFVMRVCGTHMSFYSVQVSRDKVRAFRAGGLAAVKDAPGDVRVTLLQGVLEEEKKTYNLSGTVRVQGTEFKRSFNFGEPAQREAIIGVLQLMHTHMHETMAKADATLGSSSQQ